MLGRCNQKRTMQWHAYIGTLSYSLTLEDIQGICIIWKGSSWSWSCGSWAYNYLCNQCLSPLKLWWRGVLDITLCDKVCQWLATVRWFSSGTSVSFTNKTDWHDIAEILLKVALNTITLTFTKQNCTYLVSLLEP
jgi:hypothetical protein